MTTTLTLTKTAAGRARRRCERALLALQAHLLAAREAAALLAAEWPAEFADVEYDLAAGDFAALEDALRSSAGCVGPLMLEEDEAAAAGRAARWARRLAR